MGVTAVTLLARNYVPQARVLAASFAEHHPEGRLVAVLVDGPAEIPGAEVVGPDWLGVSETELHRRAALYDRRGVIASGKAAALLRLLGDGAPAALLLDADMLLLDRLDDVAQAAAAHDVVLTPHLLAPLPGRPGAWPESDVLIAGTYNGGFLAVGPGGRPCLQWLDERARRDCVLALDRGIVYGQRWLDLVPGHFRHHVLRDWGINAMPQRLRRRDLRWEGGRPILEGDALRLAHFASFDPREPARMCAHPPGQDAMDLRGRPGLRRLYDDYAERLLTAGWPGDDTWRWERTTGGVPLDMVMRHAYGIALAAAEGGDAPLPPDPFDPSTPDAFVAWLAEPAGLSRYLLALRDLRADLRSAFPAVPGPDTDPFLDWARQKHADELPVMFAPA